MDINMLADKYRVAAPRYTSYPTVPYWDQERFDENLWVDSLISSFKKSPEGLSLYIHLPFCESLCTYCGCNTRITKNHGVELPYIAAVLREWNLYTGLLGTKPFIKEIHLGGGTPTFFSPENLAILINGITDQAQLHQDAEFSFEAHPNNTTEEHLKTLFDLGFRRLSLGIQDFDPLVQLIINRIQSVESVESVTRKAREIGYSSINYDLIYGLPLQSVYGLVNTLNTVINLNPDRIAFYSYAHVPWVKPGQRRYTEAHLPSPDLKKQLYDTGRDLLLGAGYAEIGMDHFTLTTDSLYDAEIKGNLHRNFMGYTERHTDVMIGLGVSSISDCWTAFAQNVKTVEEYLRILDEGRLPVLKGHILDETDLKIREHILNIMCRGNTSWNGEDDTAYLAAALTRLGSLAGDGLVELSSTDLKVTAVGKRFLRNICMAFDARLWEDKPTAELFSIAD